MGHNPGPMNDAGKTTLSCLADKIPGPFFIPHKSAQNAGREAAIPPNEPSTAIIDPVKPTASSVMEVGEQVVGHSNCWCWYQKHEGEAARLPQNGSVVFAGKT